jgi:putative ABC transport system permease protein
MVLKLALRNVLAHKRRTLLIGLILGFGAMLIALGGALAATISGSLKTRYMDSFTADAIISAKANPAPSLAPRMSGGGGMQAAAPEIPEFEAIEAFVSGHPSVKASSPQLQTYGDASLPVGKDGTSSGQSMRLILMGIDPEAYASVFSGHWEMVSGTQPAPGSTGLWLSEQRIQMITNMLGTPAPLVVGDDIVVSCQTPSAGIKIRILPILGIFRLVNADPQLSNVAYADASSVQLLLGMNAALDAGDAVQQPSAAPAADPFEDVNLFAEDPADADTGAIDPESLVGMINASASAAGSGGPAPRFQFLLVRLREGASYPAFASDVNEFARTEGLSLSVTDWSAGAGNFGKLAQAVQMIFNVLIVAVILVSLFVVTNSIVISVMERIPEVGTLRALGGQRKLVRRMVLSETLIVAAVFGLAGAACAAAAGAAINASCVPLDDIFLQGLLGGKTLTIFLSAATFLKALVIVAVTGIAASLYPVAIAVKIRPVTAMSKR